MLASIKLPGASMKPCVSEFTMSELSTNGSDSCPLLGWQDLPVCEIYAVTCSGVYVDARQDVIGRPSVTPVTPEVPSIVESFCSRHEPTSLESAIDDMVLDRLCT